VRKGSPTGPIVGGNSVKTTFCLIDWYKLDDNAPAAERTFFDCYASYQGIQRGWVDQDSKGNRKVEVTCHSPCESPGMCGERSTNRQRTK
jgi:hypothetical protein